MPLPEQLVEHGADQHLIGGGGAETAALGDSGGHVDIQALARQIAAQLAHAGGYAPDQRRGGVDLLRLRRQLAERHLRHGVALRQHADNAAVVGRRRRQNVQIHGGCQHAAVLMVRVVAADLRAAGRAEQRLRRTVKGLVKALHYLHAAGACLFRALRTVKAEQRFGKRLLLQIVFQPCMHHRLCLLVSSGISCPCGLFSYLCRTCKTSQSFRLSAVTASYRSHT